MKLTALAALAALVCSCSHQVFAPPARAIHLESARTVAPGERVAVARGAVYEGIFDPGAKVASAGVRIGVMEGLEVDLDATYARVDSEESDVDPNGVAARVGIKKDDRTHTVALTAGIGEVMSPAAGWFTAADAGMILSYDNCYAVPFGVVTGFLSVPIAAREVEFGGSSRSTAHTSYGFGTATGIEVPLQHQRCFDGKTPARVQLGVNAHRIISTEGSLTTSCGDGCTRTSGGDYVAVGVAAGFEIPF